MDLFLTSKVRLHCDNWILTTTGSIVKSPFPDLKGQAPLRQPRDAVLARVDVALFLTSKVRLHCDAGGHLSLGSAGQAFS